MPKSLDGRFILLLERAQRIDETGALSSTHVFSVRSRPRGYHRWAGWLVATCPNDSLSPSGAECSGPGWRCLEDAHCVGLPSPILLEVRRRIFLIAVIGAVVGVVAAALVWQFWWPSDQPPSGPRPAKRYGTSLGLSSDLYRLRGECQHPRELISRSRAYLCQFAGGRLLFVVYTPRLVGRLQGTFAADDEFFQGVLRRHPRRSP
jgi:hypothetical protein